LPRRPQRWGSRRTRSCRQRGRPRGAGVAPWDSPREIRPRRARWRRRARRTRRPCWPCRPRLAMRLLSRPSGARRGRCARTRAPLCRQISARRTGRCSCCAMWLPRTTGASSRAPSRMQTTRRRGARAPTRSAQSWRRFTRPRRRPSARRRARSARRVGRPPHSSSSRRSSRPVCLRTSLRSTRRGGRRLLPRRLRIWPLGGRGELWLTCRARRPLGNWSSSSRRRSRALLSPASARRTRRSSCCGESRPSRTWPRRKSWRMRGPVRTRRRRGLPPRMRRLRPWA